jgi:transposase
MGRDQVHEVRLTDEQRDVLSKILNQKQAAVKELNRVQILLKCDKNREGWQDWQVAQAFNVTTHTVHNIRRRFCAEGIECIRQKKGAGRPRLVDGELEAQVIAIACSAPPEGRVRWTLRLIADKMVAVTDLDEISHQTIKNTLKKMNLNLG